MGFSIFEMKAANLNVMTVWLTKLSAADKAVVNNRDIKIATAIYQRTSASPNKPLTFSFCVYTIITPVLVGILTTVAKNLRTPSRTGNNPFQYVQTEIRFAPLTKTTLTSKNTTITLLSII